ncbi:MAG: alkaline phosphatase family protein [Chloroflexota bacterium]
MKNLFLLFLLGIFVSACSTATSSTPSGLTSITKNPIVQQPVSSSETSLIKPGQTAANNIPTLNPEIAAVPNFDHIVWIVLENRSYSDVIGNVEFPYFNQLAKNNVLLTNYFAVSHPSLPNYIAMISGDTQGITTDCKDCFLSKANLGDLIEASGRSWKSYQEDMPSPCFIGNASPYYQKHNPFIYFDSIRNNVKRCESSIVPISTLENDLLSGSLPNFAQIIPNSCNSGHDCSDSISDNWLKNVIEKLQASSALGSKSLIMVVFDEAKDQQKENCCGLNSPGGGQVAAVLVSPLAKPAYMDAAPYSHYSLLKTILKSWNLPDLGNTSLETTQSVLNAWK